MIHQQLTKAAQTLQIAAGKGRTKWLQNLLIQRLPLLNRSNTDYRDWFDFLLEFMSNRGLVEPTQQKDYLSDVRNAIKVLDPNHPALEFVDFDKETWIEINNRNSDRIAQRKTKFLSNPDAIVRRATTLLNSYQWSEIVAGLAVVSGRRLTEVIKTAQFEYRSKYSVIFTGAIKRRDEPVECVFEIPTLCEAQLVIDAIASLRTQLGEEIYDLSKRQVSKRYSKAVKTKCDFYFRDLVPPREDKDSLYAHLFKAVYSTIAAYWYCPPTVPEIEYRAAIQGHYQILNEKNPILRRSIAAGRNYFDYKIADGSGNIDGRLGLKLGLPDVEIVEEFKHADSSEKDVFPEKEPKVVTPTHQRSTTKSTENNSNSNNQFSNHIQPATDKSSSKIMTEQFVSNTTSSLAIPPFFQGRLKAISTKLALSDEQAIQASFTWTEMGLSLAESLNSDELTPSAIFESVAELKQRATEHSFERENGSNTEVLFSEQNIDQICTSVRLLTEALSIQQKNNSSLVSQQVERRQKAGGRRQKEQLQRDSNPLLIEDSRSLETRGNAKRWRCPPGHEDYGGAHTPKREKEEGKIRTSADSRRSLGNNIRSLSALESEDFSSQESVKLKARSALPPEVSLSEQNQKENEVTSGSIYQKPSKRTIKSEESVERAINAIIEFNERKDVPIKDKWHIGVGSLRKLTERGDSVIKRVIESRKEEIQQHNSKYKLGKWHNARGKDYPSIGEVIQLDL